MILTEISPGHARLVLRVYFLIFVSLIAWLTDRVLQSRAKLQIVRKGSIRVHRTLGWLQGFQLVKSVYDLRQLPGGKLGYTVMVILFALSKVTDLLTTTFVVQVEVKSRCLFGQGLVLNTTGPFLTAAPPSNGIPYIVAHNAQYFSLNNTCPVGIYAKVNQDINFCPGTQDILGSWVCSTNATRTYSAAYNQQALATDLIQQGLLYPSPAAEYSGFADGYYNHLVLWSSSAGLTSDNSSDAWNVRAAIQTNASPFDDNVTMLALSCAMDAAPAETIARAMNSTAALANWRATFQGLMYYGTGTPSVSDPERELAILLNTMTMVQGGDNILLSFPALDADQTQGCIVFATDVPLVIEALVLIVAGLFAGLVVLSIIYALRIRFTPRGVREAIKYLPDGVVGWAVKAVQEHREEDEPDQLQRVRVRRREIKNWLVGFEGGEPRLRVFQPHSAEDR
ncbi:uncharacterized protein CDV56_104519 [Aspergillus thermomutatus]|uniref:Uncharacterized protein n=1 Tax=Aspergillus thermomutatus TaxID=41047 RepID=A0A397G9L2_ASPTH|nr:uncharacterized protein CDV56_104519 [Aspergillus thermomutatus]RHZ46076.1 hypothetical protein CDV56_104519 [Aspergillus thermomutatus]